MRKVKKLLAAVLSIVLLPIFTMPAIVSADAGTLCGWNWSTSELDGSITLDTEIKHSGNSSVKMECSSPRQSNKYLWLYIPLEFVAGRTYEIGMWTKSKRSESVYCSVEWLSGTDIELLPIGPSNDWIETVYEIEAPRSGSLRLMFILEGSSNGFWIDDVYIREKGTTGNMLANGGFEAGGGNASISTSGLYDQVKETRKFTTEELKKLYGVLGYIQTKKAENIVLDGDVSEWDDYNAIPMPSLDSQIEVFAEDGKEKDLKATVKSAYDDDALYLMFDVYDNVFHPITKNMQGNYWDGDSIQMAICAVENDLEDGGFDPDDPDSIPGYDFGIGTGGVDFSRVNTFGKEISFVCDPNSVDSEVHSSYLEDDEFKQITARAKNDGEHTYYEMRIPWQVGLDTDKPKEKLLLNFLINDNDGEGRRYCLEMTEGISRSKDSATFPFLELIEDESDFYSWIVMNKDTGIYGGYEIYVVNDYDEEREFKVYDRYKQKEQTVTIAANSGVMLYEDFSAMGEYQIICDVSCEGKTIKAKGRTFKSESEYFDPADAPAIKERTRQMADEIKALIDKCEEKNISTDYELAAYTILDRWVTYLQDDIDNEFYIAMKFTEEGLVEIYEEAKASLEAYLAGEKTPFEVPRYVTSDEGVEIEDAHFVATTNTDGVIERRPVFFTGWGHFNMAADDIKNFQNFGFNYVQNGSNIRDILDRPGAGTEIPGVEEFSEQNGGANSWTPGNLLNADTYNIGFDLLLGVHVLPDWVLTDLYPDLVTGSPEFLAYNIMDDRAKKMVETALKVHIPKIIDKRALTSITISNEPIFRTALSDEFFRPYWADYLRDIYDGDISRLNYNYGSDFNSFTEVTFPEYDSEGVTINKAGAKYYDYCDFNAIILSTWHEFIVKTIKEIDPTILLHSKIHQAPRSSDWHTSMSNGLDGGLDYQYHAPLFDINGNDGGSYLTNQWHLRDLDYLLQLDHQRGYKNAPAANTEDHILQDRVAPFEHIHSDYAAWQIWQGAIHGRGMSAIWVWERDYNTQSALYGSLLHRPDGISKISRMALDLQRLSYEVVALQDEIPEVALLYADSSRKNFREYAISAYSAYEALRYAGKSVSVIPERGVDIAEKLKNCKLLVIPYNINVRDDVPEQIVQFVKDGGKVLMLGEECFTKNEYNKELSKEAREAAEYIRNSADIMYDFAPTTDTLGDMSFEDFHKYINTYLRDNGMEYVKVVDVKTGENVDYVEINTAVYDGKLLVNMNSIGPDKEVKIVVDGVAVNKSKELRYGTEYGDVISLTQYDPVLLEIDVSNKFLDMYNHWAEGNVNYLAGKKVVSGISESRFAPDKMITGAEFISLLARALGVEKNSEADDINWYDANLRVAEEYGVLDISSFAPNQKLTRDEMAKYAVAFYEALKGNVDADGQAAYSDDSQIINKDAVRKASAMGLVKGYPDGEFKPENNLTRAEATTVIMNVMGK